MFPNPLAPRGLDAVEKVARLAREKFAARAVDYDRNNSFPFEAFVDLHNEGLIGAAVPRVHGGLGLGPYKSDVYSLWMMTKEIAKAGLSVALLGRTQQRHGANWRLR